MNGKVCVVTGATSGIGKAVATALARMGSQVVLVGRDHGRAEAAAAEIGAIAPVPSAVGAQDQFAALLPITERVSGSDHPDVLAVRASLAGWTGAAGDGAQGPETSSPRCSPSVSGSSVPSTRTP
jgi:NAD(P)-dependent dehydrogenase (short-subunit alcohol dehydrogenase family)